MFMKDIHLQLPSDVSCLDGSVGKILLRVGSGIARHSRLSGTLWLDVRRLHDIFIKLTVDILSGTDNPEISLKAWDQTSSIL